MIFFLQESQIIQFAVGVITLSHMIKQIIQFKQQVGFELDPYVLFRSSCLHCINCIIFFVSFLPFIIYLQNINVYSAVASNKQTEVLPSTICFLRRDLSLPQEHNTMSTTGLEPVQLNPESSSLTRRPPRPST